MKLRAIGKRVLIEPAKAKDTTESGLYIGSPDRHRGGALEGVIVDQGGTALKRGARVLYQAHAAQAVGGSGLVLVPEDDVLAVYEGG